MLLGERPLTFGAGQGQGQVSERNGKIDVAYSVTSATLRFWSSVRRVEPRPRWRAEISTGLKKAAPVREFIDIKPNNLYVSGAVEGDAEEP